METTRQPEALPEGLVPLSAVMAHDVRGPANILNITAELLESAIERACAGEIDAARLRRLAGTMRVQSRRLAHRLDAILQSWCGPESIRAAEVFELGAVVAAGLRQEASRSTSGRHIVSLDGPPEPILVNGHPSVIRQVMVEVVTNAVEAAPEGSRVRIRISVEDQLASITVEDEGPGIPPAAIDRIFDRDFTTREAGRGFGLHFAKVAVHAHGGRISATASGGGGCTIRMVLPLHRQES